MVEFERHAAHGAGKVGFAPLVEAVLVEHMSADGPPHPAVLPQLHQTYRAQLVHQLMYALSLQPEAGHEGLQVFGIP